MKFYFFILVAITISNSYAQDLSKTSFSENFEIRLDPNIMLTESYELDIAHMNFKSEKFLQKFCDAFSMFNWSLKGDFNSKKIILQLDKTFFEQGKTDVNQLNNDLLMLSRRMKLYFNRFNN
ncbi:MAG: hypothetical protein AAF489_15630 [Bacteroidota bacterium]